MCTAITFKTKDHYFGRNLDLEYHYDEAITITPRNYPLNFRCNDSINIHYAMIGMATVVDDYPLYYDATNEKGLSMAGLNVPGNAVYHPKKENCDNIAPFEFIPWILAQCATITEAEYLLKQINLTDISFNDRYLQSPLHWIISDCERSLTVESMADGLHVSDNPVGVLTNNPPFAFHMHNLVNYLNVTHREPENRFSNTLKLEPYSRGMGAIGLPGDLSSASRFVRASFTKLNSLCGTSESESISQFFHILGSVIQQNGCVQINHAFEKTIYSSCCNTRTCAYYYTTYENSQISCVCLFNEDLEKEVLISYPLIRTQQINMVN